MKSLSTYLAACAVLAFSFSPVLRAQYDAPQAPPPPDAGPQGQGDDDQGQSFQQFYDQLGDQGSWVQTNDYGYVFQPNVQDPNWAPYSDGHWVYTDSGWMWVSDEPWGWATYHYGRWANIDGMGWAWIPGYQWAPAWVSWRYGGGYCGWAPLPPETFIGAEYAQPGFAVGVGFHFGGDVDVSFNIGPGCYNFVPVGYLGERNYRGRYLDRSRNFTVINNTTNITNININGNNNNVGRFRGVAVGGPPINEINAHASTRVQTLRLAESNRPGRSAINGDTVSVYAPRVNAATSRQGRPARVAQTLTNPTFNRGDSITQPMQVTRTLHSRAATPEEIQSAQTAAAHVPARAKIATAKTESRTQFTQPLTSLQPVNPNAARQTHAAGNRDLNKATTPQANTPSAKDNRVNKTEADKAPHVNQAPVNPTASQDRVQQQNADRVQAAQERKDRLQQQQATHQQAMQDAAQARQERAAAQQQRAGGVQQQHAPAQQQHAPAQQQQQRVAPTRENAPAAHNAAGKNEKDQGQGNGPQGR